MEKDRYRGFFAINNGREMRHPYRCDKFRKVEGLFSRAQPITVKLTIEIRAEI